MTYWNHIAIIRQPTVATMPETPNPQSADSNRAGVFHTTCWSMVLAAGRPDAADTSAAALQQLCQSYWFPVYAYVRRRVHNSEDARELTQAFFERLLATDSIAAADPERGRFRTFLLTTCQRFVSNELRNASRQVRGGGRRVLSLDFELAETRLRELPVENIEAEDVFEYQWAITLLNAVVDHLRQESADRGKLPLFDALKSSLSGMATQTYAQIAADLNMQETAIKVAAHRMKARFRELIREHIAQTVDGPEQIEDEIRRLFLVLSRKS